MSFNSIYAPNSNFIGLSADHRNGHKAESIDYELPPRKKFNISGPIYGPALLLLLAACGGGGSGSTAPDILPIPPTDNENGDVAAQGLKTISESDKIDFAGAEKKIEYNDEGLGKDVLLQEAGKDNPKIYEVLEGAGRKEEIYDVYFITGDDENNAELRFAPENGGKSHYIRGYDGDDIITGGSKKDWLYGERGSDILDGGGGDDILFGGKNNDFLHGRGGADMLNGGDGHDSLEGGSGEDSLDGGTGNDTASYASSSSGVVVDLSIAPTNNGYIEQVGSGYSAGDMLKRIENITGGDGADTLTGDSAPNILIGNAGKDTLLGGAGNDTLDGGADAVRDILTGGVGADTFYLSSNSVADEADADLITDFVFGTDLLAFLGKDIWFVLDASADNNKLILYADASGTAILAVIQGTGLAALTDGNFAVGQKPNNVKPIGFDAPSITKAVDELVGAALTIPTTPELLVAAGAFPTDLGGTFIIEATGDDDVFDVNEGTGSVTWKAGTNINHEDKSSYSFMLLYMVGDAVLARQNVTVNVTDINDNEPAFSNPAIVDAVADEMYTGGVSGDIVYTADATPDVGNDAIVYAIKPGAGESVFRIYDSTSGEVRFINDTSIKTSGTYAFTITATVISSGITQLSEKIITWDVAGILRPTPGADTITGNSGDNDFTGHGGNDLLYGRGGDDTIYGGTGKDTLYGDEGDDKLFAGPHIDFLYGGTGNDVLLGEAGADTIDGGEGNDTASYLFSRHAVIVNLSIEADSDGYIVQVGAAGNDANGDKLKSIENITGGIFNDRLTGDMNDNILNGSGGADTLDGGGGVDTASYEGFYFSGRSENSTLSVTRASAVMVDGNNAEGIGARTVAIADITGVYVNLSLAVDDSGFIAQASGNGHASGDKLKSFENLTGSNFKDVLVGNQGDNVLTGGAGDDILIGGKGADTLDGGAGADTLVGGDGADKFVLIRDAASGTDTITDFTVDQTDKILIDTKDGDETTLALLNLAVVDNGEHANIVSDVDSSIIYFTLNDIDHINVINNFGNYFEVM